MNYYSVHLMNQLYTIRLQIQPNSAAAVYFPIVPRDLGQITLKVEARSVYSADAVERKLLVEVVVNKTLFT